MTVWILVAVVYTFSPILNVRVQQEPVVFASRTECEEIAQQTGTRFYQAMRAAGERKIRIRHWCVPIGGMES